MDQEGVKQETAKYPWNPKSIGVIGFLFSFLPAGIMHALNYKRLGRPELARFALITTITSYIIFLALVFILLDDPLWDYAFGIVNISICYCYYQTQWGLFKQHIEKGGKKETIIGLPIIYSFLWLVVLVGGVYGWSYVSYLDEVRDTEKFNEAVRLLNSGEYIKVEPIFKKYKEEYPEDTAAYWNLAIIYQNTDRLEMAKQELENLLKIDPTYEGALEFLKEIEESLSAK